MTSTLIQHYYLILYIHKCPLYSVVSVLLNPYAHILFHWMYWVLEWSLSVAVSWSELPLWKLNCLIITNVTKDETADKEKQNRNKNSNNHQKKQRNKNKESPTTRKPVRYEGTEFILKMCVCTLHIVMGFCDITLNVSLKHFSILAGSGIELS